MAEPWIGTREDRWTDILPQSWQSAINTNPMVNALQRYMQPRPSFDQAAREWQDNIPGNSPIDRIAEGRSTIAKEYPSQMNPLAADMLEKGGFLANFLSPGAPKLPTPAAPKPQGIKAYHGSPHDFDRFDISKIGTGEGAQAYGRGLYFAESEEVAKSYRDTLGRQKLKDGTTFDVQNPAHWAAEALARAGGDKTQASRMLVSDMTQFVKLNMPDHYKNLLRAKEMINRGEAIPELGGRMYEVRINADPEKFLDWDKPLAQQPEAVKQRYLDALGKLGNPNPSAIEKSAFASSGEGLENLLQVWTKYDRAKASNALRDAGIPGIRYKDAMSRGTDAGTSNYVVFDDKMIEILRKYGLLPPLAAGAAQAVTQGQDTAF